MKFLPVKERNMTMLMRLPVRRLSLKAYIEKIMIPDIIAHEGSEFLSSLFWGAQPFVCDLYNGVWEQYAQERPFNTSDFRIFDAESKKHEILYVEVPVLPGLEEICSCALAFASDISGCRRVNIRSMRLFCASLLSASGMGRVHPARPLGPKTSKTTCPSSIRCFWIRYDLIFTRQQSETSLAKARAQLHISSKPGRTGTSTYRISCFPDSASNTRKSDILKGRS